MEDTDLSRRLEELAERLQGNSCTGQFLGVNWRKVVVSAISSGFPEHTVIQCAVAIEGLLKELLRLNGREFSGNPTIETLLRKSQGLVNDRRVSDYIRDVQRARNRAGHHTDSLVTENDAVDCVRRVAAVLDWFQEQHSHADKVTSRTVVPDVARRVELISGLLRTLDYEKQREEVLSRDSAYLLFRYRRGARQSFVELIVSRSMEEILEAIRISDGTVLKTDLPIETRYLILHNDDLGAGAEDGYFARQNVCSLHQFVRRFLGYDAYRASVLESERFIARGRISLTASIISYDENTQDYPLSQAHSLKAQDLGQLLLEAGNIVIAGGAGSGKSTACHELFRCAESYAGKRYAFFFDLGSVSPGTTITEFIEESLRENLQVASNRCFDAFHYLVSTGLAVCIFDGFDEMFTDLDYDSIVRAFAEITQLFTYDSKIVVSMRPSFLASSRSVRELFNAQALVSERISQSATSAGINPLDLPSFSILCLQPVDLRQSSCLVGKALRSITSEPVYGTPLMLELARAMGIRRLEAAFDEADNQLGEARLIYQYWCSHSSETSSEERASVFRYFAEQYRQGRYLFDLNELFALFGKRLFRDDFADLNSLWLKEMFVAVDRDCVRFSHRSYLEFCVAYNYVATPTERCSYPINERIRRYVYDISRDSGFFDIVELRERSGRYVAPGRYIVGDYDRARVVHVDRTYSLDERPVSVGEFMVFQQALEDGEEIPRHPAQPMDVRLGVNREKLKIDDYLTNPRYRDYAIVCVSFWTAWAYARWVGKRLPTSIDWECAARGDDGRLFPWGDKFVRGQANSADFWAKRTLIDYEDWKREFDREPGVRPGRPLPCNEFPMNISPFGQRMMSGNIWEMTATGDLQADKVVICGGSFDNVVRGIKASSKGIARTGTESNAVGFRCAEYVGGESAYDGRL